MAVRELPREQWEAYFNRVSRALEGKHALVEVASLNLGDQIEAEWAPLRGVVYEPQTDTIVLLLERLDDRIPRPRKVFVDEEGLEVSRMEIEDAEGTQTIVQLKDPLALPPPS